MRILLIFSNWWYLRLLTLVLSLSVHYSMKPFISKPAIPRLLVLSPVFLQSLDSTDPLPWYFIPYLESPILSNRIFRPLSDDVCKVGALDSVVRQVVTPSRQFNVYLYHLQLYRIEIYQRGIFSGTKSRDMQNRTRMSFFLFKSSICDRRVRSRSFGARTVSRRRHLGGDGVLFVFLSKRRTRKELLLKS